MIRKGIFFNKLKQPMGVLPLKAAALMNSPGLVGLRKPDPRGDHPDPVASITDRIIFFLDTQFRFSYIHHTETKFSYFDLVSVTPFQGFLVAKKGFREFALIRNVFQKLSLTLAPIDDGTIYITSSRVTIKQDPRI